MFEWEFVKKIDVTEPIAFKSVKLARDCGLRPADSIDAASASSGKPKFYSDGIDTLVRVNTLSK